MNSLKGKRIFVTGGASGIGAACVERLVEEGAKVAWSDINVGASEQRRSPALNSARSIRRDVTSADGWRNVEHLILSEFGELDGLVNNAGVYCRDDINDVTQESFRRTMAVNAEGPLLGCQMALRLMTNGVSIINVASVAAIRPGLQRIAYGAAKAALVNDLSHRGIPR